MKIPWDKLKTWQFKSVIIIGIISAASYFQPKVVFVAKYIYNAVIFQEKMPIYDRQIKMLVNYVAVDKGLAKSQMELVDSLPRYVKVEVYGELIELKADVYRGHSGDCKVFVDDGDVGMYATYYNYTEGSWEYYDFYRQYHLTYIK